jgi:hypothetical protein
VGVYWPEVPRYLCTSLCTYVAPKLVTSLVPSHVPSYAVRLLGYAPFPRLLQRGLREVNTQGALSHQSVRRGDGVGSRSSAGAATSRSPRVDRPCHFIGRIFAGGESYPSRQRATDVTGSPTLCTAPSPSGDRTEFSFGNCSTFIYPSRWRYHPHQRR